MRSEIKFVLPVFGLIVLGVAFLGYFKAIPGVGNQSGDLPRIEAIPAFWDFGEIAAGDIVSHSFTVKNSGADILEIKRVVTSCACAAAKIAKDKIESGEEAELQVTYDSGAMPLHGSGREERIIYLRSNDPVNPQIEVRIYATVIN